MIVSVLFIYFTIKLEDRPSANPPLEHLTGKPLCFSLIRLSLSWRVHGAQCAQHRQINMSFYPL